MVKKKSKTHPLYIDLLLCDSILSFTLNASFLSQIFKEKKVSAWSPLANHFLEILPSSLLKLLHIDKCQIASPDFTHENNSNFTKEKNKTKVII